MNSSGTNPMHNSAEIHPLYGPFPKVTIPEALWHDDYGDGSRLGAALDINGIYVLHVVAFRVAWFCACVGAHHPPSRTPDERQVSPCRNDLQQSDAGGTPEVSRDYEELSKTAGQSEPWKEITIHGRQYVLFAYPPA
jgi:hypothetical protein